MLSAHVSSVDSAYHNYSHNRVYLGGMGYDSVWRYCPIDRNIQGVVSLLVT